MSSKEECKTMINDLYHSLHSIYKKDIKVRNSTFIINKVMETKKCDEWLNNESKLPLARENLVNDINKYEESFRLLRKHYIQKNNLFEDVVQTNMYNQVWGIWCPARQMHSIEMKKDITDIFNLHLKNLLNETIDEIK